jgi:hypothetical protein
MEPIPVDWRDGAHCRNMPPERATAVFFHQSADSTKTTAIRVEANAHPWCSTCRVRIACLEQALEYGRETQGIWGGLGQAKRRHLQQARSRQTNEGHPPHRYTPGCSCSYCRLATAYLHGEVIDANTDGARHGYRSTYGRGCRCPACTYVKTLWWRHQNSAAA